MSWRVACLTILLCGENLGRPSLLGAAPGHHGHHDHGDHHHGHDNHHEMSQSLDYNYAYDLPEQARSQDVDDYYDENADKSYAFQFAGDEYRRDETAQADGSVEGSYSYTGADGVERTVNYRAGNGIGFEIIGENVDQMFKSFGKKTSQAAPASDFSLPTAPSSRNSASIQADSLYGAPPLPAYGESSLPGYASEPLPSASTNSAQSTGMMMDPSYYFEYKSADSQRTEDADSTGNIVGSYKYKTAGGNDIEIRYKAGL